MKFNENFKVESCISVDWLTLYTDNISLRQMFSLSTAGGIKRQTNDYIDRPDTVTVGASRQPTVQLDYEMPPPAEPTIYEETNIDEGNYEGLGRRETNQPVYQDLVKDNAGRPVKSPTKTGRKNK